VEALADLVHTGRWGVITTAANLQACAESLGLGEAALVAFRPGEFLGDRHLPAGARQAAEPGFAA
jgi:hypothetical protein